MWHRVKSAAAGFAVLVCVSLSPEGGIAADMSEAERRETYVALLDYEFSNRTFAYVSTRRSADLMAGEPAAVFFEAYHALEIHNRSVYRRASAELGHAYEPHWYDRFRGYVVGTAGAVVGTEPQMLIDLVDNYLPKLEELKRLSASEHSAFFNYVLAQETVQRDAAITAKADGW